MDRKSFGTRITLSLAVTLLSAAAIAEWEEINVYDESVLDGLFSEVDFGDPDNPGFLDDDGVWRYPGCSKGPQPIFDVQGNLLQFPPVPHDGDFSFFVERGSDDLLIYLSGGGNCWDPATCVGSALTPFPVYSPVSPDTKDTLDAASVDQSGTGGILTTLKKAPKDVLHAEPNPFAKFTKVFIPYCTGDVHVGSKDQEYTFILPDELGGYPVPWEIRHRGFDNLRVVLKWLQSKQGANGPFRDVTVAGSSAGGYGALINFPVIRQALDEDVGNSRDYSLIIDSSNGVLTNGFLDRAFGLSDGDTSTDLDSDELNVWGARENIDALLQPTLNLDAKYMWRSAFKAIGRAYPDTRISQSTSAFDFVQALVLYNMKRVDDGSYNPFALPPEEDISLTALLEWSPKARVNMLKTAFSLRNYRYYLGKGAGHEHLVDPPAFPFPTTNYFAEASARNVRYTAWLDDMLNNPRRYFRTDWRNLSCFPNCLPSQ